MLNGHQEEEKTTITTKIANGAGAAAAMTWDTVKTVSFYVGAVVGVGLCYAGMRLAQAYLESKDSEDQN